MPTAFLHDYPTLRRALLDGEITAEQVTAHYLMQIEQQNAALNAFLEVYTDQAIAQAKAVDAKIKAGTAGKLAGMVVGLKDVLCHQGHGLQASSKILNGFISQFNGTAVERLLQEDAIIIGRQNCDEFAMGSSNENSAFGPVRNAKNQERVPGGSSGGSAVAVQAGMCMVSLGSDTGGSVRQPASFCGIYGLKPSYSRISRHGLIAYGSSFDCIGIFANTPADVALTLEVIAGKDEFDSTVSQREVPAYSENLKLEGKKKFAILKETLYSEGIQPEVKEATQKLIAKLKAEGHSVEEISFPYLDYCLPIYYILSTAEASTNLSRYDGVRYGYRSEKTETLEAMYKNSRSEGFGKEVQRRIMLGTFVLSASYYDAYFTKAQRVRRLVKDWSDALFAEQGFDFMLSPTAPSTAFPLGRFKGETVDMYLADLFTVQASLAGLPAISVPYGEDKEGMPIGMQLVGRRFGEDEVLALAEYLR